MAEEPAEAPDSTAVRVALWRAMHVQVDPPPHVLEDEIGLQLVAPDDGWRARPDMDPVGTRGFRAAIVARARFIEDLVAEQAGHGVAQYVILGAGLDTFAQRQPGARLAPAGVRGRPARSAGLEAATTDRARLRHPRLAAAGAGRLRGERVLVAAAGRGRLRSRPARGRRLHRRHHVPHQGGHRGHPAPARRARSRFDAGDDVPAARPSCSTTPIAPDSRRPRRARAPRARRSSASTPRRRCWPWPARPASRRAARLRIIARRALLRRSHRRPPPVNRRGFRGRHDLTPPRTGARLPSRPGR